MVGSTARPADINIPRKERDGVQIRQTEIRQRDTQHRKAVDACRKCTVVVHHRSIEPRIGV